MAPRERRAYLWDVVRSARLIREFTKGKTFADYEADILLRSAVERQFEIIGEALGQAVKAYPELGGEVTDIWQIIAFRNLLIHAYATVGSSVVWGVVEEDLPMLLVEVESLLAFEGESV